MIIEFLMDMIKTVNSFALGLIPSMDAIQLPVGFMTWFTDIVNASVYFLPIADFLAMFAIWLVVVNFNIIQKLVTRIWDALPFT